VQRDVPTIPENSHPNLHMSNTRSIERLIDVYQVPPTESRHFGVLIEQMFECDLRRG
jgi:hypothetical protein